MTMKISDSFLKAQLQNVYWIGGAGYGGKTTITDLLARRHGFLPYHPENLYHDHKKAASPEDHPAILAPFHGWEHYFNRPLEEYMAAITDQSREHFQMVVLDLIKLSAQARVVADVFMLDPWDCGRLTEYGKCIFLYADEDTIRKGFFDRADKQDLLGVINTLSDPEKTRIHVAEMACALSSSKQAEAQKAGVKVLVRDSKTPVEETLTAVENHFNLTSHVDE